MKETFAERLKYAMERESVKQAELSSKTGLSMSLISQYLSGKFEAKNDNTYILARALNCTPEYLLGWNDKGVDSSSSDNVISPSIHEGKIPILGVAPCGEPIEAVEDIIGYVDVPRKMQKDHFALKAKGDSMTPKIESGDIMVIKQCSSVDSGKVAIVKVNGEEATCKKIIHNENGITLIPLNSNHEPLMFTNKDIEKLPVTIIGEVVEIRRKL